MDLLDSILGSMEKPPTVKKPEIKDKDKREKFEKLQKQRQEAARKHKQMVEKFREDITKRIKEFVNTPTTDDLTTRELQLEPMSKVFRSMVREVCEEHDDEIVVHSFGTEEVDRHCTIWKQGCEPGEEELRAMKLGVEYKPRDNNADQNDEEVEVNDSSGSAGGKDKFWSKYEKVIGENAYGLESARVALPAKQYGCVPIDNKKDQRSIEQMMDDIRRSKKQKTSDVAEGSSQGEMSKISSETDSEQKDATSKEAIESPEFSSGKED